MNCCDTINIFVYGTLMQGQRAHHFLDGCTPLGTWLLRDYAMYRLKNYPGILKKEGKCVIGEVYMVPKALVPRMDEYEDEGYLYHRRTVTVTKGEDQMEVQAYIYAREVDPETLMQEPWGSADSDLVWYAAYGSNLEYERFMCYLNGETCKWNGRAYPECKDQDPPREICVRTYPGRLCFSNSSPSWKGSSVAFFDPTPTDRVVMRLYKITREQLRHVHVQEGNGATWYPNLYCLGLDEAGTPIYTVTAGEPKCPAGPPSHNYRECILSGLAEMGFSRSDAEAYLAKWI